MTEIADEFQRLILEKTSEEASDSKVRGENVILLKKEFQCAVCFRTSRLSEGFWGVQSGLIIKLKKLEWPYVFVFLLDAELGFLLKDKFADDFFKYCSQGKQGDYKIHEEELVQSSNIPKFRTIDELIDYLSPYRISQAL